MPDRERERASDRGDLSRVLEGSIRRRRPTTPQSRGSNIRRSTRILERLSAHVNDNLVDLYQDSQEREDIDQLTTSVTRLRQRTSPLAQRSAFQTQERQNLHTLTNGIPSETESPLQHRASSSTENGVNGISLKPFEMNVIIQPPTQARPNAVLNPPLVVRVEKTGNGLSDMIASNPAYLFAVVTIIGEDGRPERDALGGIWTDSLHVFDNDQQEGEEVGFLAFPNMTISRQGRFQLRVSLMQTDPTAGSQGTVSCVQNSPLSQVIHVDPHAETPPPGRHERAILDSLHRRGLRVKQVDEETDD